MRIRKPFFIILIAAILGMIIACEDPVTQGSEEYTVSFEANGGSLAPQNQTINKDGKVTEPAAMTKTGYGFAGWYKETDCINLWNFDTDTVTGNTTLYAKWDSNFHTVIFVANGGNPVPKQQNIAHGGKVVQPQSMSKEGFKFEGWYKEEGLVNLWNINNDTVTQNIVLYAKWEYLVLPTIVQGTTLAQKLQWLNSNAASNNNYILEVSSDEFLNPHTLSYSGKRNILIQLIGIGSVKTVEIYGSGSLFTIENNVTLILNENIVLKGKTNNTAPLVMVNGGNLILNDGSKITGNSISSSGSGVYVNSGTFAMNGGEISGNSSYSYSSGGGGVYVGSGTFTMNGGKISVNTSSYYGGGMYLDSGTFTMNDGEISGNTSSSGGGVYVGNGTFTMSGGEISDNTSSSYGGGVYIGAVSNSEFQKTGGIITGYSSDTINGNVVKSGNYIRNNCGHAVYAEHSDSRFIKYKEFTAGQQNNLTYIRNEPAPIIISGDWNLPVPEAPGAPVVTTSSGSLTVQWTEVERALAYEVWMGTTNNSVYAEKRADVFDVSTTLTDLTNGTIYYVWLKAKNDTGTSGFSPMASGKPVGNMGTVTFVSGNGQFVLSWSAIAGADQYEVYHNTSDSIPVAPMQTVSVTTATISELTNGITYYVWVKPKNANGSGEMNAVLSGKPIGNMGAVTLTAGESGQLILNWSDVAGADQYEVYYNTSASIPVSPAQTVSATTAAISGLIDGTLYYVWVRPKNANGTGAVSDTVSKIPMMPPGNLTLSAVNQQITVSWNTVTDATSYEVYYSQSATIPASPSFTVTGLSRTITGLTNGTTYYFWVKAVHVNGTSAASPMANGKPIGNMGTVTLTAGGSGQLVLSWSAVAGADQYEVYYSTANTMPSNSAQTASTTTSTISGLTNGTTYYVWVKPKNANGSGGTSTTVSGKPIGNMGAVTLTTGEGGQLILSWSVVTGADQYEVYYNTNNSIPAIPAQTVSTTTATISGLTYGTTYYVWVKGKNTSGTGNASTVVSGRPLFTPGLYLGNEKIGNQNLSAALSYIQSNAVTGDNYIIVLGANESISPMNLNYSGKTVEITLLGYDGIKTITLTSNGCMFTINSGITLKLDENITLQGHSYNNSSLVSVGGALVMNAGSAIRGNTAYTSGGGVNVSYGGIFTMNGGVISGNTTTSSSSGGNGGGVSSSGTFTMNGGVISGNTVYGGGWGGGVFITPIATFTKTGGTIYGYSASDTVNSNVVKVSNTELASNNGGHAVCAYYFDNNSQTKYIRKETTAGPSVNLSFNGTSIGLPTWSGGWDYY